MKSRLYSPELNHALLKEEPPAVFREHFRSARNQSDLTQLLYVDFKTTLADQMLTKVDRMSMAVGLEARVPFLDHTLIEFAAALPDDLKLAEGEGKRIIKQAMEPQIPRSLLYRKKHGFTLPVGKWLADGLRDRLEDALSEERIKRRGLFDPQAIRSLLRLHRQGKRNCSAPLFNLYMLELWHQTFLDP
ncbi:MAG: asparagine synthetase B, partial [Nitrospinaceae bacterium]|nr:asparagine synthetase B [Nitrospinaceae bacterium]NIR55365.1 asparagine synthetase B [Nitrospinaceae bacterium]NIS85805.1 asparagine synthetase B [Nitrospinaceae bacterium]NIT82657.1 asparagine synthetase B [Nitrospinaceae bacterium]NIU44859.1 asparagine synthetase B [Nitrospinaceae bacterium]